MAVEPDSAGVRFPPPFLYLGALLFVAGAAMMLAAAGLFRRLALICLWIECAYTQFS